MTPLFFKILKPLLNTHFISEFTISRMKPAVLSPVEESKDADQRGQCRKEAQEGPWGHATSCPGTSRGTQRDAVAQRLPHPHRLELPRATLPFRKQCLGFAEGKMIRFYYKHSPGTPLAPTKAETLSCHHLSLNVSWEPHFCKYRVGRFSGKEKKPAMKCCCWTGESLVSTGIGNFSHK